MEIPNLLRRLNHCGTLKIIGKDNWVIDAVVGDPGGNGHVVTLSDSEEITKCAEDTAKRWVEVNRKDIEKFKSVEYEWPEDGCLNIPGIGKVYRDK